MGIRWVAAFAGCFASLAFAQPPKPQVQPGWNDIAINAALETLRSADGTKVAHGVEALATLHAENEVKAIASAYQRLKQDSDVRLATAVAFGKLRNRIDVSIPILIEILKASRTKNEALDIRPGLEADAVYRALVAYGDKARSALPALLDIIDSERIDAEQGEAIAAIGLESDEDANRLIERYIHPRSVYSDDVRALRGLPPRFRLKAAIAFLPMTKDDDVTQRREALGALSLLAAASPQIIARLEEMVADALWQDAASALAAILAANPPLARSELGKKIYAQGADLVDIIARQATNDAAAGPSLGGSYQMETSSSNAMIALAALSPVSARAKDLLITFLRQQHEFPKPRKVFAQYLAVDALPATGTLVPELLLATLPYVKSDSSRELRPRKPNEHPEWQTVHSPGDDLDSEEIQPRLWQVLEAAGPFLVTALPQFLSAFNTSNQDARRMLSWAIFQTVKNPIPDVARLQSLIGQTREHVSRGYLVAAYLKGGGDPNPVVDAALATLTEPVDTTSSRARRHWEMVSGNWALIPALVRRSDVRWSESATGQKILDVLVSAKVRGDAYFDWADLTPFGPLSLSQSLQLLERRTRNNYYVDDPSFWASFLAPDSRNHLAAAERLYLHSESRLPSDATELRREISLLTRCLPATARRGALQFPIAQRLTLLYARGIGQWGAGDEELLSQAARSLEEFAMPSDGRRSGSTNLQARDEAARTARSIRDHIVAEQQRAQAQTALATGQRQGAEFQRHAAAQLQQNETARRRLVTVSAGLSVMLAAGLVVVFSVSVRRHLSILAGQRWNFISGTCDGVLEISGANAIFRRTAAPAPVVSAIPAHDWPPPVDKLDLLKKEFLPGWNIRILAEESQFRRPWSHFVGSGWSDGSTAVVAGQLCVTAPESVADGQPVRSIAFAAYACAESPGCQPLRAADAEIQLIERTFRRWGGDVRNSTMQARCKDVVHGLLTADMVHIAAHSSGTGIHLSDGFVDLSTLRQLRETMPFRCRLLVLSSCQAGVVDTDQSFVYELVRSGVNVLAAREPVVDHACMMFFEEFYKALLPARRAEGIDLGTSIRRAADACMARLRKIELEPLRAQSYERWKDTVDSFTLYGDPSIHLRLGPVTHGRRPAKI